MHGRILVVDDDAAMRDLLREELELRGYTVRLAASAEAALAAVELDPADVVVTD
ncbi:MAG: response regulator, partial [bacterium]